MEDVADLKVQKKGGVDTTPTYDLLFLLLLLFNYMSNVAYTQIHPASFFHYFVGAVAFFKKILGHRPVLYQRW